MHMVTHHLLVSVKFWGELTVNDLFILFTDLVSDSILQMTLLSRFVIEIEIFLLFIDMPVGF